MSQMFPACIVLRALQLYFLSMLQVSVRNFDSIQSHHSSRADLVALSAGCLQDGNLPLVAGHIQRTRVTLRTRQNLTRRCTLTRLAHFNQKYLKHFVKFSLSTRSTPLLKLCPGTIFSELSSLSWYTLALFEETYPGRQKKDRLHVPFVTSIYPPAHESHNKIYIYTYNNYI